VGRNTSGLKRGGPGRKKGVPNKATLDAKALAEGLVDDPVYLAKLRKDLRARKVAPPIEQMIWYYAKGKPKDVIELEGRLNADTLLSRARRRPHSESRSFAGEGQAACDNGETSLIDGGNPDQTQDRIWLSVVRDVASASSSR
jgi:hypothetical protein